MNDDPILALERELVGAAHRQAHARERVGILTRPRRQLGGPLSIAASVLVVLAVGAIAFAGLHGHTVTQAARASRHPTARSWQSVLRSELGVLRRPQTAADRRAQRWLGAWRNPATTEPGSVRIARLLPWGARAVVAIVRPTRQQPGGLALVAGNAGVRCCGPHTPGIAQGAMTLSFGAQSVTNGGWTWVLVVVPDGVTRVSFAWSRTSPSKRVDLMTTHRLPVIGNVAAAQLPIACCATTPVMTWYTASGRVVFDGTAVGAVTGNWRGH